MAQGVSLSWEGELSLLASPALEAMELALVASFGAWELEATSAFEGGVYEEQSFRAEGFSLGYRLSWEGKCVLSPQGRVLKRLTKSLDGAYYDQLCWGPAGPHFRYAWLEGEFPSPWGDFSAKAYRASNYTQYVAWLYFLQAYRWDAAAGRWLPISSAWAGVKEAAYIAAKVRLKALVGGTWRSRTEYNLRASFDPAEQDGPFSPAEEAVRYLDAKYREGWYLREPIALEEVKVYLWRMGHSQYTCEFESAAEEGEPSWSLEAVWEGQGGGISLAKVGFTLTDWRWCRAQGELELVLDPEGFDELSLELEGLPLLPGLTTEIDVSLDIDDRTLSIDSGWEGGAAGATLRGGAIWDGTRLTGLSLYALECGGYLGVGRKWRALWVIARPPSPRPSWYTGAHFRALASTDSYEDGLLALERWWYSPAGKCEISVSFYFAPGEAPFGLSRLLLEVSLCPSQDWELGLSFQSRDPAVADSGPSLVLSWDLKLDPPL